MKIKLVSITVNNKKKTSISKSYGKALVNGPIERICWKYHRNKLHGLHCGIKNKIFNDRYR